MVLILTGIVLLSWGGAGIFDKKSVQRSSSLATFLMFHLFNIPVFLVLLVVLPFFYGSVHISWPAFFWELANAICAMAALLSYYQAMRLTQASWLLGITASYPIIGQLAACLFLGEPFSMMAITAALVISLGIAAIGYSKDSEQSTLNKRQRLKLFAWVAFTTVIWGVLGIFDKKAIFSVRPLEAYLAFSACKAMFSIVAVALMARGKALADMRMQGNWKYPWCSAALVEAGNIGFLLALPLAAAGYLIVVTACYPAVMYVGALAFLKEPPNYLRIAGIGIIIIGLVLANLPVAG